MRPTQTPLTLNQAPDAVEYARIKAGLTKVEAARLIGKSAQLYGDIEAGRRNATPAVMQELAKAFNCPIVVLERKRDVA